MSEPAAFVAVIVSRYVPPVPGAGVPASVAVPSPLSVNVTPDGSLPVSDNAHVGHPVVATVMVPAWPTSKVAWSSLVIWHAWLTVRTKGWVAAGLTPFVAVMVNGYVPPELAPGIPASVAVPFLLSVNVTPVGSAPVSDNVELGTPLVVTVKVPVWPVVKVVPAGLVIPGTWLTVRMKAWVPAGLTPFVAVIVNGYGTAEPAAGVPESVPVPSLLSVNVTPGGRAPVSDNWQRGYPVVLTVYVAAWPTVKVVPLELVIWHAAALTVRVKFWVASGLTPFVAVIVNGYGPPVVGVAASVAVPSPLSVNVTPVGSVPFSDKVAVGTPVEVTVKVPAWPTVKAVPRRLVILGAWLTVRVKAWVASGLTPFVAVIVNGYGPLEPGAGVPARVAVPSLLSVNVTPVGSVPVSDKAAVGTPVEVTVKVPAWPAVKVVPAGLVIPGAWLTVRVKYRVEIDLPPFAAVIVSGYVPTVPAAGVPESVA